MKVAAVFSEVMKEQGCKKVSEQPLEPLSSKSLCLRASSAIRGMHGIGQALSVDCTLSFPVSPQLVLTLCLSVPRALW